MAAAGKGPRYSLGGGGGKALQMELVLSLMRKKRSFLQRFELQTGV
jgi:hypothetical protein